VVLLDFVAVAVVDLLDLQGVLDQQLFPELGQCDVLLGMALQLLALQNEKIKY